MATMRTPQKAAEKDDDSTHRHQYPAAGIPTTVCLGTSRRHGYFKFEHDHEHEHEHELVKSQGEYERPTQERPNPTPVLLVINTVHHPHVAATAEGMEADVSSNQESMSTSNASTKQTTKRHSTKVPFSSGRLGSGRSARSGWPRLRSFRGSFRIMNKTNKHCNK
jgi:hypothetical protein